MALIGRPIRAFAPSQLGEAARFLSLDDETRRDVLFKVAELKAKLRCP
jgi:hypothetical protein